MLGPWKNMVMNWLNLVGGCDQAIKACCWVTRGKFRKLLPILTSIRLTLVVRGKVYSTCVRSAILHSGETWAPNVSDLQCLHINDHAMIRCICNTKLTDNLLTDLLLQRLGIYGIEECLRLRRLRWYGHVKRASCCVNQISNLVIPGPCERGRPRKTWSNVSKMIYWHTFNQRQPPGQRELAPQGQRQPAVANPRCRGYFLDLCDLHKKWSLK